MSLALIVAVWLGLRFVFSYFDSLLERQPTPFNNTEIAEETTPHQIPFLEGVEDKKPVIQNSTSAPVTSTAAQIPTQENGISPARAVVPVKPKAQGVRLAEVRILLRTIGGDIVLALYPEVRLRQSNK